MLLVFALALCGGVNGETPDAYLDVPEMIVHNGYPQQSHRVFTEDGYALTIHRIPHGLGEANSTNGDKPVVLLQHGLFGSSSSWLGVGVSTALGYMLANAGYDVWMGNMRGNKYSTLYSAQRDPRTKEYWDFSWHEAGIYDMPATIDYILAETGKEKLFYVGHSLGTTLFYVMTSMRPEYNDKVTAMVSLGPIAYLKHIRDVLRTSLVRFANLFSPLLNVFGFTNFGPQPKTLSKLAVILCYNTPITESICNTLLTLVLNINLKGVNETVLPVVVSKLFEGSSVKAAVHLVQEMKTKYFRQYDYGKTENLQRYGSIDPPSYDTSKITAPVALFYGDADTTADAEDVVRLSKELPNLIELRKVPFEGFRHQDFVVRKEIPTLINEPIIEIFHRYGAP